MLDISDEEAMGEDGGDKRLQELWAKKSRRRSSELKILVQDNLEISDNSKLTMHLAKNGERSIFFSDVVTKVNRKGRTQDRWLMITDGAVYNIDPTSAKIRRRIALSNISHISTSQLSDNVFLIHVPTEYDYLYISGRKTEIVAVLRLAYMHATGEELNVALHNIIDYRIDKEQQRRLVFQRGEDGVFTKIYAKKTTR